MKLVSLISSGIDSPVATFLLAKKADEIILVHADIYPFSDFREVNNFLKIAEHLKGQIKTKIKTYLIPHGSSLECYKKNSNPRFTCVFCKRMLLRYAEKISEMENADAIIMGDSLGQVASQTLQNINTIEQAVKIPVLRPLIGMDKEDIIKIAKKIGTYDLSILPSDSCTAVPDKPATMAKIEQILNEENEIDIANLVENAIDKLEKIDI